MRRDVGGMLLLFNNDFPFAGYSGEDINVLGKVSNARIFISSFKSEVLQGLFEVSNGVLFVDNFLDG